MGRISSRMVFRSSSVGAMISWRLKARSWLVSLAARVPAFWISVMSNSVRVVGADAREQQLAETENHRQQIVEVVRHAAGQASDGFHLLGLLKLRLQRMTFGHIL